ncbi:HEAT repeat domain-containing protein [Armatimonas rosea]|uniref:HEAT repeat domain-containing protein n=1 Tax=Armatimonas rosea TaxID=685828 RepID=A0A7W9SWQ3_ARMRO|nr:HEAT repeat domain-containing protein [Armatimonas rosea]MBB6053798.1 hypothetical protein [Armatimonas rosea]
MSFEQDLARGRGRAVLFLQSADQATRERYREPILHACCNNYAYDTQIEGSRDAYLLDMLEVTKDIAWYTPHLRAAFYDPTLDTDQLFGLCTRLHQRGHADFTTDLYAAAEQLAAQGNYDWDDKLLALGDAKTWQHIAVLLGTYPLPEDEDWRLDYLYEEAQKLLGRRVARHAAPRDVIFAILALRFQRRRERKRNRTTYRAPDLSEPMPKNTEALKRWLIRFRNRPFPGDPADLIALTYHENPYVTWRAMLALGNLTDPRIRTRALEALADPEEALYPAAVRLLARNTDARDLVLLTGLFRDIQARNEESQVYTFSVHFRDYAKGNPELPLTPLLLSIYENTPSSFTRRTYVELLLSRNDAPPWLLTECRYDCDEETRSHVAERL